MTLPTRVVFLGSGGFAVPILEALRSSALVDLVSLVSTPPRPAGRNGALRSTPVADRASALGVPILLPDGLRVPAALAAIEDLSPDLLVLADYGRLVPSAVLDVPPHGALNLHPSLLPRHRGATPIPAAIAAGDSVTGVSLIRMDAGIDTGPIIAQHRVALRGDEDAPGLEAALAAEAALLLIDALPGWLDGRLPAIPQAAEGASLTRPFRREDGRLDATRSAAELERQVRAMRPWPGTFLERGDGRILVWSARAVPSGDAPTGQPLGSLMMVGRDLGLVTAAGVLLLLEVQPAGGRRMPGSDLARGRPGILGAGAEPAGSPNERRAVR